MSIKRRDLLISAVMGLLLVIYVIFISAERGYSLVHGISDGCFTAGVILAGVGGLVFCTNKGFFNLLGYSSKFALSLIIPIGKNPWDDVHDGYYNYCQKQASKEPKPFGHLLVVGGAYLALSVVFLIIYVMTK